MMSSILVLFILLRLKRDRSIVILSQTEWIQKAISLFQSEDYQENPDHVKLLAWRNKTVDRWNNVIRQKLWGTDSLELVPKDRLIAKKPLFRVVPGMKGKSKWKIILNNSEEVSTVESGILCETLFQGHVYKFWKVKVQADNKKQFFISMLHQDSQTLYQQQLKSLAEMKRWQLYFDLSRMFDDMTYAFGLTVHRSQGSTIDYVFLDASDLRGCRDLAQLQYTALTRARKQLFVRKF